MPGRYLVKLIHRTIQSSGHVRATPGRVTQTFFASRAQIFKEQSRGLSGADNASGRFVSPKRLGGQSCRGNPQVLNHEQIENRTDSICSVNTDLRFFRKYKSNAIGDLGNHTFSCRGTGDESRFGAPIHSQIATAAATREAFCETVSSPAKTS